MNAYDLWRKNNGATTSDEEITFAVEDASLWPGIDDAIGLMSDRGREEIAFTDDWEDFVEVSIRIAMDTVYDSYPHVAATARKCTYAVAVGRVCPEVMQEMKLLNRLLERRRALVGNMKRRELEAQWARSVDRRIRMQLGAERIAA